MNHYKGYGNNGSLQRLWKHGSLRRLWKQWIITEIMQLAEKL